MRLRSLVEGICPELPGDLPALEVPGLVSDSRRVGPGDLFVAVPGTRVDGAAFAAQAVRQGAAAVVAERDLPGLGAPVLRVDDAALALGLLADRLHGEPSRTVRVTGVTGTNGKTTTTYLLSAVLAAAGRPNSLLGTVVTRVGGVERQATMTTPDVLTTHAALASCREAGERDLVMEVSSHALDQRRVAGVRFGCAVFTNLTRDHLDYHGTLQAYFAAKARLFEGLDVDGVAVLNGHDPMSLELARRTRARCVRFGWSLQREGPPCQVSARIFDETLAGTRIALRLGRERRALLLPLVGRFNVENSLAAAAAAWAQGVPATRVAAALASLPGVPGRLERVPGSPAQPTVLVDYAHTPDALERVLHTLRPLVPARGKLRVVFGCGGDRDPGKRPLMGRAVASVADQAVLTNDNPRSEPPERIARAVLAGCRGIEVETILDRAEAIRRTIEAAGPRDLVLLAGKGHETTQTVGERVVPFDDRDVARRVLRAA